MEYTKVIFSFSPYTETNSEILSAELAQIGYESFCEADDFLEAYIPSKDFNVLLIEDLKTSNTFSFVFHFTYEIIEDQNWNEVWEKNFFQPLLISDRCLIRAPFHTDFPTAEYEIVVEPGMAFGTGNHETTTLMIEEILKEDNIGKSILDMGCGTGVLGILASMKGARDVTCIDIDSWAFNSTLENVRLNSIENLKVILGDASSIPLDGAFDYIYANIHKNIILNDIHLYSQFLKPNGCLVTSGFYINDLKSLQEKAIDNGLSFTHSENKNDWALVVFKKI